MPIPTRFNPMGKSNKPTVFELVVKPGILATTMSHGIIPYWNSGGFCTVDWGDGSKQNATKSASPLNHTFAVAGTYTIKIKAYCYRVTIAGWNTYPIVDFCSGNWNELGELTDGGIMFYNCTNMKIKCLELPGKLTNGGSMFYNCANALLPLISLPAGLKSGNQMFIGCTNAQLPLTKLPEGISNVSSMFRGCKNAQLPLTALPDSITDGTAMFSGCTKAQLSLTKLPEGLENGTDMFNGCTNATLPLTKLPDGLTNGNRMFSGCTKAQLPLTKLPDGLKTGTEMFSNCVNAEINLDTLVANAPAEGWTALTNISNMFGGASKVTGSRSAFLAKCPNVTAQTNTFYGTNTTA